MNAQIKGGKHDSVEIKNIPENSALLFQRIKAAFFNINQWDHLFSNATQFQVTDEFGKNKSTEIEIGDLIKIKIPGPKNKVGNGYDWIRICNLESSVELDNETCSLVLSPCPSPFSKDVVAHFFGSEATNYFVITKKGNQISAEVHGRNEIPNVRNLNFYDKIRNFFVAHGGIFGLSSIHWKTWTKNILNA